MSATKFKNFSYLKGPKGDKGDKGDPGKSIPLVSGRITFNPVTGIIGFNEAGLSTKAHVDNLINNIVISYNELTNKPTLFSGIYADLADKPAIPNNLLDLNIEDGINGQFLITDGQGNFTFSYVNNSNDSIIGEEIVFEGNPAAGGGELTSFHPIAISGNYNELVNKPLIPTAVSQLSNDSNFISSVDWADVQNKPILATVAASGSYNNLIDKPSIPHDLSQLTDFTGIIGNLRPGSYNDLTDKPNMIDVNTLKSIVAASADFADFKSRISNL